MPDATPTEEQEQLKRLLKRWRIYSWISLCFLGMYAIEYTKKRFAKKLTTEEYEMLVKVGRFTSNRFERNAARELTRVYQHINPQKEYLRATIEPQDETLLRAAQYTNTTPQDQLLRPTDENNAVE